MAYIVTGERAGMVEGVILIETPRMVNVENLILGALKDGFNVNVEMQQDEIQEERGTA